MPKDSTITELDQLANRALTSRSRFEPSWYMNLAYYQGNQWLYYSRGRLQEPILDPWRVTFTDNRIIGVVRTEVAKMTKQKPIFVATPTTGAEEDLSAAKLGERMLSHIWTAHDLQRKQRAALLWSRVVGAGFWKVYWDSSAGKSVPVLLGPDGKPVLDSNGRPMDPQILQQLPPNARQGMTVKNVAQGDLCVECPAPMEMLVDPLAGDEGLGSAEWLIQESVRSTEYVKQRYDVELEPDADAIVGLAESRMGGMSDVGGSSYKGVKIREYWAKPSSEHPGGRYAVWGAKKMLKEDKNAYECLPYVMFNGVPVPGRFWPTSVVEQLRGPQTELNKTRSQIRENAARIGNPSLLKNRLANVDYTGLPGEIVEYDDLTANSVPAFLQPPEMPGYVEKEIDWLQQSFAEISGQHEVSAGQVPPGVTAASAISLLQEQDDTRLGPDISDMENALGEAGRMVLKLVAQYYTDERTVQIAGEDGDWDVFSFRGSQLRECTHVSVQAGSAIPLSKAGKQAAMRDVLTLFIQNGVAMNQRQLGRFLQDMEVGGFERLVDQYSEDEQQVNGENRRLGQGMALPLNTFDNDEAHVELHQEFMKSPRYMRLPPEVHMVFEQHVALHQQRQQQVAEQQFEMQLQQTKEMAKAQAEAHPKPTSSSSKQGG